MPIYDVIKPGFIHDVFHKPDDPKHNVVVTDKPLSPTPSWLKLRGDTSKPETKRQRTARLKREAAEAAESGQDKETAEVMTFAADTSSNEAEAGSAVVTI